MTVFHLEQQAVQFNLMKRDVFEPDNSKNILKA